MAKVLKLTGRVSVGKKGEKIQIGAGTKVTEIAVPDKKYGLNAADIERIVRGNCGVLVDDEPQPVETDPERLSDLLTAISELDPDNKDHYTEAGLPQVSALEEILDGDVTAAERDAAWEIYNA